MKKSPEQSKARPRFKVKRRVKPEVDEEDEDEEETGARFAQKWSPQIAARGYTSVPALLLAHYSEAGLKSAEMMFLIHLLGHYRASGQQPWPLYSTLAKKMGYTREYVAQAARVLDRAGWIKRIERRRAQDSNRSNKFDLQPLIDKTQSLAKFAKQPKALALLLKTWAKELATARESTRKRTPKKPSKRVSQPVEEPTNA